MDRYSIAKNKPVPSEYFLEEEQNTRTIRTGEPCGLHRYCLSHRTSPYEGCGRIAGQGELKIYKTNIIIETNYLPNFGHIIPPS